MVVNEMWQVGGNSYKARWHHGVVKLPNFSSPKNMPRVQIQYVNTTLNVIIRPVNVL